MNICFACICRLFLHVRSKYYVHARYKFIPLATIESSMSSLVVHNFETPADRQINVDPDMPSILTTKSLRTVHYMIDPVLAEMIAAKIFENRTSKNNRTIIEVNPGPCILSRELLKAGFERLVGLEPHGEFSDYFQKFVKNYEWPSNSLQDFKFNMFAIRERYFIDGKDSAKRHRKIETRIMNYLAASNLTSKDTISVYACFPQKVEFSFLTHLLQHVNTHEGLLSSARMEWFVFVSHKIYKELYNCKEKSTKAMHCSKLAYALSSLFYVDHLLTVEGREFAPRFIIKKSNDKDASKKYLVRLTPKPEQEQILPVHHRQKYLNFLKQILTNKSIRFIPKMEQLVPGCGVHLIKNRFSMTARIYDLYPTQMLHIFKLLETWPEYQGSPLQFHLSSKTNFALDVNEASVGDIKDFEESDHVEGCLQL